MTSYQSQARNLVPRAFSVAKPRARSPRAGTRRKVYLESCRTPIHKLNRSFGLNTRNSCINVLRHHVTTKQQTAGHVFSMTRVALHHLVSRFKARSCDLSDTQLFVVGFLGRDNWSVSGQRKVYTGVWHQIGLKSKVRNKSLSCCLFNLLSASMT